MLEPSPSKDAQVLTNNEKLVYAAAFAHTCASSPRTRDALVSAWVAVMHVRGYEEKLQMSVDWNFAHAMYDRFRGMRG